jgi:beta-mannosidase
MGFYHRQGYPNIRTVDYWTGENKAERYPQSRCAAPHPDTPRHCARLRVTYRRTTVNHNKADGFERRIELYLMENFKHAFDMERLAAPTPHFFVRPGEG